MLTLESNLMRHEFEKVVFHRVSNNKSRLYNSVIRRIHTIIIKNVVVVITLAVLHQSEPNRNRSV